MDINNFAPTTKVYKINYDNVDSINDIIAILKAMDLGIIEYNGELSENAKELLNLGLIKKKEDE